MNKRASKETKETRVNPLNTEIPIENMDSISDKAVYEKWISDHDSTLPAVVSNFDLLPVVETINFQDFLKALPAIKVTGSFETSPLKTALSLYSHAKTTQDAIVGKLLAIRYLISTNPEIKIQPILDVWNETILPDTVSRKAERRSVCSGYMSKLTAATKKGDIELVRGYKSAIAVVIASMRI